MVCLRLNFGKHFDKQDMYCICRAFMQTSKRIILMTPSQFPQCDLQSVGIKKKPTVYVYVIVIGRKIEQI